MGRLPFLSIGISLPLSLMVGGAALWAASVTTSASLSVLAPSLVATDQEIVTGMVALPLVSAIGASTGALSLPTQSLSSVGPVSIGTESIRRDIGQVISRAGLQQASFTIIGDSDQVISITVPPTISLSRLSGEGEVEFNPVTSLAGLGSEGRLVASADGVGELAFDVGGRLQPTPAAAAGEYAGVLRVTVQYN